jgi:hypothetical protein
VRARAHPACERVLIPRAEALCRLPADSAGGHDQGFLPGFSASPALGPRPRGAGRTTNPTWSNGCCGGSRNGFRGFGNVVPYFVSHRSPSSHPHAARSCLPVKASDDEDSAFDLSCVRAEVVVHGNEAISGPPGARVCTGPSRRIERARDGLFEGEESVVHLTGRRGGAPGCALTRTRGGVGPGRRGSYCSRDLSSSITELLRVSTEEVFRHQHQHRCESHTRSEEDNLPELRQRM